MILAKVQKNGRVTLPGKVRGWLQLRPGDAAVLKPVQARQGSVPVRERKVLPVATDDQRQRKDGLGDNHGPGREQPAQFTQRALPRK